MSGLTSVAPGAAERRAGLTIIDHRLSRRLAVRIPALLHYSRDLRAYGIVNNLSRAGCFVETSLRLDRDCCLDLVIPDAVPGDPGPFVFPALVVRRSDRGLGLGFRSPDAAAALEPVLGELAKLY